MQQSELDRACAAILIRMGIGARLGRMLSRIRYDTDVAVMDRRRHAACEHDVAGECDSCYWERRAESW